jgi:hypothetical protein
MLNLSPLFYTTDEFETAFLDNLELTNQEREYINAAKTEVRTWLREGIPRVMKAKGYTEAVPRPRFFTQGSWAYKTLNAPAQKPQQADIDDGCYLPLSFVTQTRRPSVAAAVFFQVVEEALAPLAAARKWKLIADKATCVRLEIAPQAHIDVPLYAIPDQEFATLSARVLDHGFASLSEAVLAKAERNAWTALPRNSVLLAHREEDWIESDPRPVKDWFEKEVLARGDQLRRVVRYLKAYRDWAWPSGGPASLLLMAAAVPVFERRHSRDDLALADVLAVLPGVLRKGVCNPVDDKESLTDRLRKGNSEKDLVEEAANRFEECERLLRGAMAAGNAAQACTWMQQAFGARFPEHPYRVKVVSVAATIAATPAVAGPSELVGRTRAG